MEEIYYKKILLGSGEVPEDRQQVTVGYTNGIETYEESAEYLKNANSWWSSTGVHKLKNVIYWLKPVSLPSPKQEAVELLKFSMNYIVQYNKGDQLGYKNTLTKEFFLPEELYDKFKQDQLWGGLKDFPNKAF